MNHVDLSKTPHRRYNLLTGEWVLVSPVRTERPWSGQEESSISSPAAPYDADCYLCPGNARAGGKKNPLYEGTYTFTNDFAALIPLSDENVHETADNLLRSEPEHGICRVICYTPRHDLTIARMQRPAVSAIVDTWIHEYEQLGSLEQVNHVQIFENRGLMMGCSNPHPHGQIWANSSIPTIPGRESREQKNYYEKNKVCLLCDYLERELTDQERILFTNDSFVALVPFWAFWPFETMIIPRFHAADISSMSEAQKSDLAELMISLGIAYDNLFHTSFPYSMGFHQQPTDGGEYPEWHWHIHYLPPLLRSQSIKKHMVGYELLAMPQRDITPESAVSLLRALPGKHYLAVEGGR